MSAHTMRSLELQLTAARSKIDEQAAELSLLRTRVYALNLPLVDAAPDLLAACEALIQRVDYYAPSMGRNGDLDDARAAIAKAGGEA